MGDSSVWHVSYFSLYIYIWSLKNDFTHCSFRLSRVVENIENLFLLKIYAKLPSKRTSNPLLAIIETALVWYLEALVKAVESFFTIILQDH